MSDFWISLNNQVKAMLNKVQLQLYTLLGQENVLLNEQFHYGYLVLGSLMGSLTTPEREIDF